MTANKIFALGILLLVGFILITRSMYAVQETEHAIVIQLGEPKREVSDPGLYFKLPWEDAVKIDKRNLEYDLDRPMEVSDVRQERLTVDAFARYRITQPQLYYQRFISSAGDPSRLQIAGERGIRQIMENSLRQALGEVTIQDIITNLRTELMDRIESGMQSEAQKFGVQIIDVKIRKADYPDDIAETVYGQMRAQRQERAELIRAEGRRESTRIKAEAERERAEILAKANQESLEIKGDADATRNATFNEAYNQDPEFFAFYRSLIAYEQAFEQGETTILLSPDSEFLRYFNDLQGRRN